jgi:hypothetical protein
MDDWMPTALFQKLQLKPDQRLLLLNPPQGYAAHLASELAGVPLLAESQEQVDAALLFVNNLAEVASLATSAIRLVKADGLLWIAYPKVSSKLKTDVNRDTLWKTVEPTGWRPVRQIALDEVWSAMRFRPSSQVGK